MASTTSSAPSTAAAPPAAAMPPSSLPNKAARPTRPKSYPFWLGGAYGCLRRGVKFDRDGSPC